MTTPRLGFQEIAAGSIRKWLLHNLNFFQVEAWIAVKSRTNSGPPVSPTEGDAYIVDALSGDWSGFTLGDLAVYYLDSAANAAWRNVSPAEGPAVWVEDEDVRVQWNATTSTWEQVASVPSYTNVTGTTYTPSVQDNNSYLRFTNASGCAVTIPNTVTEAFPLGTILHFSERNGSVTISPAANVTFNGSPASPGGLNQTCSLILVDSSGSPNTDTWDVIYP